MRRPHSRGFTVPEIMVVASVFAVIGVIVTTLFSRGNSVYRHSETHIEMQRTGRNAVARLTPYISSMFDGDLPLELPIVLPPTDPEVNTDSIVFFTTEDWLAPGYPSEATSSLYVPEHSLIEELTFLYRIRYQPPEPQGLLAGGVVLERLDYNEATFNANNPATYPVTDTRTLFRCKTGERIENFRFTRVRATVVVLEFDAKKTTRSESNTPMEITEPFRATFNLPCSSL